MTWTNIELVKVCDVFADGDWIESKDQSEDGVRLIQTGNVGFGYFKARESKARYISEETFKRLRCTEIMQGDILVSRLPDPVGRACVIPELDVKSITAVDCTIIRAKKEILDTHFLNYYCQSPQYFQQVQKNITGATRQRISRSLLGKTEIPLPPLTTQKKIVTKLDAIFAEIDKGAAAVEANAKNAEAFFQSLLNETFERSEKGWVNFTFDELVLDKQVGLVKNTKEQVEDGKFCYLKMNNITNDNKCNLSSLAKVNATKEEVMKYKLNSNDFLFNTRNSVELVGKVCVFDGKTEDNILFNNNIMRVRFKPTINPHFILLAFAHKNVKASIEKLKTGTTNVAAIYYKDLKDLNIQVPNIEKQNNLVAKMMEISSFTHALNDKCKKRLINYHLLKQSILKQAFNGELVKE